MPVGLPERPTAHAAGAPIQRLHEVFERQAALRPQSIAVCCGPVQVTYAQLDSRANQFAHFLIAHGILPGDCVGLLLHRSVDLYVALLGILKSGAAYVPLDPEYPPDRVQFILGDCQAAALVTTTAFSEKLKSTDSKNSPWAGRLFLLDQRQAEIQSLPGQRPELTASRIEPAALCYIIYTSGTTGRPKGVQIEHRSVCHLVRAESEIFQVQPGDRVYQGFSIAFDASVEEIWLAFHAGATLVAATSDMARAGPALSRMLGDAGVTVLSCVPTLLTMMEEDVPSLRLLILGGEVCSDEIVKRWWKPGRRVVNTYGPTEATVIATFTDCHPEEAVTIGRPLRGCLACIVDEKLRLVPEGESGELCLGGPGLARGYVGRPELTSEKFVSLSLKGASPQRFYRTGDRARRNAAGDLEFVGRLDAQVKLRGFRIELSEIESVLVESPDVSAAAVVLREDTPGCQQMIAYIVPRSGATPLPENLRALLHSRLPPYMVPAQFLTLTALPTMPSGKVDRQRLPAGVPLGPTQRPGQAPITECEKQIHAVWTRLFAPTPVSITDDFFLDLGGHSLLAARLVSELRRTPLFRQLSMVHVYKFTTIQSLAKTFEPPAESLANRLAVVPLTAAGLAGAADAQSEHPSRKRFWRHFLCGAAQLFSLIFLLSFSALQWLAPYLTYTIMVEEDFGFLPAVLGAFASLVVLYPLMLTIPILAKWVLVGRYQPGEYPLWGSFYFRWWLATGIESAVPVNYLRGTPLLNVYLRLMGARIGRDVALHSDSFTSYDLLFIGDGSSINADANLLGYTVEDGLLKIGKITIGQRCFVGARAGVGINAVMEDHACLEDLSLLPRSTSIPRGETWRGSPAEKVSNAASDRNADPPSSQPSGMRRCVFGALHGLGLLLFPVLVVAALFPGIIVMNRLNYIDPYYWYLFLSPLVGVSFVLLLCLEIAAIKWLLLGKVKPGRHGLDSFYYLRKWFVDQTMELSLDVLGPLYASVYLAPWYKLLGAKLGHGAEISTASFISPDLLSIGEESFIADSVSLGAPRVRDGFMAIGHNHIGKRSFIGNSAMLPPGTLIGDNVLIGCLSSPPANPVDAQRADSTWLGSPPMFLPQRQQSRAFSEETTFHPGAKLRVLRAAIEFVRVITPSTCFIILLSLLFSALLLLHDVFSLAQTLLFFPALYLGCGLAATLLTIVAKWTLVWHYRPGEKPLWSTFVWRNELLNALHEHLAEPFLVGALSGTPFLCWYFRLLGARIGRRVYLETTDFSEFDLACIGDEAALNADCTIQTHLFEDRVMKMSTVEIGPRCTVGAGSLVLYDTRMDEESALGELSLLMKGESLPAQTRWQGIPARSAGPNSPVSG